MDAIATVDTRQPFSSSCADVSHVAVLLKQSLLHIPFLHTPMPDVQRCLELAIMHLAYSASSQLFLDPVKKLSNLRDTTSDRDAVVKAPYVRGRASTKLRAVLYSER